MNAEHKNCLSCGNPMKGVKDYKARTHCIDIECQAEYELKVAWQEFVCGDWDWQEEKE